MSKHIEFRVVKEKAKTKVWGIYAKASGDLIGDVSWYAPWRQYCFEAEPRTVWAGSCLQDVASFIKEQMEARA